MLKLLMSIGGFVVGGGTVYTYAWATDQKIEWRGIPVISFFVRQRDRNKKTAIEESEAD